MKRIWIFGLIMLGISSCGLETTSASKTPEQPLTSASLPDLGAAPELTNDVWLNVDEPLQLADLRGKVVALEMWTFG